MEDRDKDQEKKKNIDYQEPSSSSSPREMQITISNPSMFPGFRFSPTDEELLSYYLKKKIEGCEECVEVIPEVEICRYEPWDLPAKAIITSETEWFFFSARGRKYPNGLQSKRATELGYWKATGKERNVKVGNKVIGTKRTLVFHLGRAPKGERTEWIMHEFSLDGKSQDSPVICRLRRNTEFRLNETSNQALLDQRQISDVQNKDQIDLRGGINQVTICENCAEEGIPKVSASSYDSHSIEQQLDSASESNQRFLPDLAVTESTTCQKDSDVEEDFFADILNDDIINLDEAAVSAAKYVLPIQSYWQEAERISRQPIEAFMTQILPLQDSISREVTLRRRQPESSISSALETLGLSNEEQNADKHKEDGSWSSGWKMCFLGTAFTGKTFVQRTISRVVVTLTLLVVVVYMCGGLKGLKMIPHPSLYPKFWH